MAQSFMVSTGCGLFISRYVVLDINIDSLIMWNLMDSVCSGHPWDTTSWEMVCLYSGTFI